MPYTKKILITGGAGNVGSALVRKLIDDKKNFVVVVDNLSTGNIEKLPNATNLRFVKADCNDFSQLSQVMYANNFDYVFHSSPFSRCKNAVFLRARHPIKTMQSIGSVTSNVSDGIGKKGAIEAPKKETKKAVENPNVRDSQP